MPAILIESFGPLNLYYTIQLLSLNTGSTSILAQYNVLTSNISQYNLEQKITIMSDNFGPLFHSSFALLKVLNKFIVIHNSHSNLV